MGERRAVVGDLELSSFWLPLNIIVMMLLSQEQ